MITQIAKSNGFTHPSLAQQDLKKISDGKHESAGMDPKITIQKSRSQRAIQKFIHSLSGSPSEVPLGL